MLSSSQNTNLVSRITTDTKDKKKFIDIEEGWSMLDDYAEENIETFFRKGRKTKTSIRMITQDVEEIKGSRIAGAMKNNASTCILLYNEKESSRKEMGKFLGLSELELEKYGSLRRREGVAAYREVLIKEMDSPPGLGGSYGLPLLGSATRGKDY